MRERHAFGLLQLPNRYKLLKFSLSLIDDALAVMPNQLVECLFGEIVNNSRGGLAFDGCGPELSVVHEFQCPEDMPAAEMTGLDILPSVVIAPKFSISDHVDATSTLFLCDHLALVVHALSFGERQHLCPSYQLDKFLLGHRAKILRGLPKSKFLFDSGIAQ